ncbi:hypothetical protein X566_18525 [Afipia sp. P52-10]|jgi:hypothetical protein|uniref:hypothetical protein n=1 Tax=Afipia sp. P52-10 TaxID=1429916 RepID=UPI0003DEF548|nr:hypothetical protein [Afipia sp. P52-10]ETR74814.1 hypothetical protein X566_18525 [Afipia sp. P52-10]
MTTSASSFRQVPGRALLFAAFMLVASPAFAQSGPFAGMEGNWTGTGHILIKDGGSERIRCRASYKVESAGAGLHQILRCASDSYRFDLTTNVTASGNSISGSWSETSRNINGTVGGRVSGSDINALVEANGFSATFAMQTRGNRQTVAIRSQNTDLRGLDITLSR